MQSNFVVSRNALFSLMNSWVQKQTGTADTVVISLEHISDPHCLRCNTNSLLICIEFGAFKNLLSNELANHIDCGQLEQWHTFQKIEKAAIALSFNVDENGLVDSVRITKSLSEKTEDEEEFAAEMRDIRIALKYYKEHKSDSKYMDISEHIKFAVRHLMDVLSGHTTNDTCINPLVLASCHLIFALRQQEEIPDAHLTDLRACANCSCYRRNIGRCMSKGVQKSLTTCCADFSWRDISA